MASTPLQPTSTLRGQQFQHPQRSGVSLSHHYGSHGTSSPSFVPTTQPLSGLYDDIRPSSPAISSRSSSRLQQYQADMTSHAATTPSPLASRSSSNHARIHKRSGSGSQSPLPSLADAHNDSNHHSGSSTPKIKPYLRKMSSAKTKLGDQGQLDLSKSKSENERLAGLGIDESNFGTAVASDDTFAHSTRITSHTRTTSIGSQMSTASGPTRPNQPFVHPMRQTPRPYTPPAGSFNHTFAHDHDEATERDDIVPDDDFRLGQPFRPRRSTSISSAAQIAPTPLSQSHSVADLTSMSRWASTSQTNLSIRSGKSSRPGGGSTRPRRDTDRSLDTPSSRTSLDKALSYVSRKSESDTPGAREERIRAARRKFAEREASKDRKAEHQSEKKQERHPKKMEALPRNPTIIKKKTLRAVKPVAKGNEEEYDEKLKARSYEEYRPSHSASLPRVGTAAGGALSEKSGAVYASEQQQSPSKKVRGGKSSWVRFSAWWQTRMLGCGSAS